MVTIDFTHAKYLKLKESYKVAVEQEQSSFIFEGVELVTQFAMYLLEHLDDKFKHIK